MTYDDNDYTLSKCVCTNVNKLYMHVKLLILYVKSFESLRTLVVLMISHTCFIF